MAAGLNCTNGNCGMAELHSLYEGPEAILRMQAQSILATYGIVMFSDGVHLGNGKRLAEYINANKLGTVVASPETWNPRYDEGHNIQAWLWIPDRAALREWSKDNPLTYAALQDKKAGPPPPAFQAPLAYGQAPPPQYLVRPAEPPAPIIEWAPEALIPDDDVGYFNDCNCSDCVGDE
jgi:hypothetical protein